MHETEVMEAPKTELAPEFQPAAAPPQKRVTVTLDLDADLLDWLKEQPMGWQQEINNTMRFFMETSLIREQAFADAAGLDRADELDTAGPDPARNASKIDSEFIPS